MSLPGRFIFGWLLLLSAAIPAFAQAKTMQASEAKTYAGQTVKVCGLVASVYQPRKKLWRPTILNFEKKYPATEFSALIWRAERAAVGEVRQFVGRRICVSGEVYLYRGRAQMKLRAGKDLGTEN